MGELTPAIGRLNALAMFHFIGHSIGELSALMVYLATATIDVFLLSLAHLVHLVTAAIEPLHVVAPCIW